MQKVSKNRKLVLISILSAISTILMIFPTIPMFFGFMKLDFSIVIVLIGMYLLDFSSAVTILLLRSLLKIIIFNNGVNDWVGMPMNTLAIFVFITSIWIFTRQELTIKNYVLGSITGTIITTGVMAFLNWVYAIPLYEKFANFSLVSVGLNLKQWIVNIILPFNIIQGIALTTIAGIIVFALKGYLKRQQALIKR